MAAAQLSPVSAQTSAAQKSDAQQEFDLGMMYSNGNGVPKDLKKAARLHRKAAEKGLARAEYQLGLDYALGEGVKPDQETAFDWFNRAAAQGLSAAEYSLGLCYANGRGIAPNEAQAAKWFRAAAAQGWPDAEAELGQCYLDGVGVTKDIEEGVRWLKLAADHGSSLGQSRLAACYTKGTGLPKDDVQAYKWFALAAAQDNDQAADIRVQLAKLESTLTGSQVALAQRLARQFQAGTNSAPETASATTTESDSGMVNITAEDPASEVFVDGSFMGNPPAKVKLKPGAHVIEVRKKGAATYRRELSIQPGAELTLRAVFANN